MHNTVTLTHGHEQRDGPHHDGGAHEQDGDSQTHRLPRCAVVGGAAGEERGRLLGVQRQAFGLRVGCREHGSGC